MNELKMWFEQHLHNLGITKLVLIKKMNYPNTDKGLRRLSEFLEYPNKSSNEFISLLCSTLNIELGVLHQKIEQRKKQITKKRKPFIQLIHPYLDNISPLSHRGWLRELLRENVPEIIQRLPIAQREKQLQRLYDKKLKSLDHKVSRHITGFIYYEM